MGGFLCRVELDWEPSPLVFRLPLPGCVLLTPGCMMWMARPVWLSRC